MRVEIKSYHNPWPDIRDSALFTIGKEGGGKEPTADWKYRMLVAEHSPIRMGHLIVNVYDVPTFVVNHFVRHHVGFTPFVQSKREDRSVWEDGKVPDRNTLIGMRFEGNFQAFLNISRKRLCRLASEETRKTWQMILKAVGDYEPELYNACVPECVYRGWCPEYKSCGFYKTDGYAYERSFYIEGVNDGK